MKGGATKILLDFDAEKSIHAVDTGSGKYMLTPSFTSKASVSDARFDEDAFDSVLHL
jgi:hypothetical protein